LNKGLAQWVNDTQYDVYCFQETKADDSVVRELLTTFPDYHAVWSSAEKKGYSGTLTLTRQVPNRSWVGIGVEEFDNEGRNVFTEFDSFLLWNTYLPSGSAGEHRQASKDRFLEWACQQLPYLRAANKPLLWVGDLNIAHTELDIHNATANKNSSGFLPHERAWLTEMLEQNFVDTYRHLNPDVRKYSWWTFRSGARERNIGWRIDYQLIDRSLVKHVVRHELLNDVVYSDHCPTLLELHL
jgi:exodeoxyribonuclease-3